MRDAAVEPIRRNQKTAVVNTLAAAFVNDPALSWVVPDSSVREQRLRYFFGSIVGGAMSNGVALTTSAADAATLWRLPGKIKPGFWENLIGLPGVIRAMGDARVRGGIMTQTLVRHHPHDFAHWYLQFAGVAPVQQGKGLGGIVIRAGLERAALAGLPVYLETATESNVGLYQRLGFAITNEFDVPDGGPHFWSMVKP